jgi:protein-S-isoprenylcysteine O-methyltransferase Ste14
MLRIMGEEPAPDSPERRRQKTAGTWVGYVIFTLVLLYLICYDLQVIYQHQWADVTGCTVFFLFILLFVIVPTGGAKRLRRVLRCRKSPR